METIYLAAGCFWGAEKLFSEVPGVKSAISGYANGKEEIENPSYELVCTGTTNFKETVKVDFDPEEVTLRKLLLIYYSVIDPTVYAQQGADRGTQYQTGIYYTADSQPAVIEEISGIVKDKAPAFWVELEPIKNFYPAEEYHQKYLDKNPGGYCHIPKAKISELPGKSEEELLQIVKDLIYY